MPITRDIDGVMVEPTLTDANGVTQSEVVIKAVYILKFEEGGYTDTFTNVVDLDVSDLSSFSPYSEVTKDTVLGWVSSEIDVMEAAFASNVNRPIANTWEWRTLA